MNRNLHVAVFGEALFDCFEGGACVLGGAPFNVAWHLQAWGDEPVFISGVGADREGQRIREAMRDWGMTDIGVQTDPDHATGEVTVSMRAGEPHYDIRSDRAYDFISDLLLPRIPPPTLLYHGTLALRNAVTRHSLDSLILQAGDCIFVDVNLRSPWWDIELVARCLLRARWGKLNQHEMAQIGYEGNDIHDTMKRMRRDFDLEQLIVTCGEEGAYVCCRQTGLHFQPTVISNEKVDTVGAGDAFSAMYIHGLRIGWPVKEALASAQRFAAAIVGRRGAIVEDREFYRRFS